MAAAVVLAGCASWTSSIKSRGTYREDAAAHFIWVGSYKRTDSIPRVRYISPDDIPTEKRCLTSIETPGFRGASGACVAGETKPALLNGGCDITVVLEPEDVPSTTALAHELLHCARLRSAAPLPHHSEGGWHAPPARHKAFYDTFQSANAQLQEYGL